MKKLFQILLLVVFAFVSKYTFAQNNMEDVVYLKNGGIYRGIILEQIPEKGIKIQTHDRSVIAVSFDEIEKILKEIEVTTKDNDTVAYKKRGYINLTEICYGSGYKELVEQPFYAKGLDNPDYFGFRMVNGYQVDEHLSLGVGIEGNFYKNHYTKIPVTFDVRLSVAKGKVSPMFIINGGYSFDLHGIKGGYVINPQIGFKAYISKNTAYLFNVGLRYQQVAINNFYNPTMKYFMLVSFSTGFSF